MAARIMLVSTVTGERRSVYTVDAKELLKEQDERIKMGRRADPPQDIKREWVPDSGVKAAPPVTEDERIIKRMEQEEAVRAKARAEADALAKFEREGADMPVEPEPEPDPMS